MTTNPKPCNINLNLCKPGDKLLTKHGLIVTYLGKDGTFSYPHLIKYPSHAPYFGSEGTRLDNGQVFEKNRLPEDEDIVQILTK